MSRTVLFVDGSNIYAGQYQLVGPNKFLYFPIFLKYLEKKMRLMFSHIYYYASYSPQPRFLTNKIKAYLKNEAFFYKAMKEVKNSTFFKGYRSPSSGKEKEVDVKMAVDIVDLAHRKIYDHAVFISGDADFMHALTIASALQKKVSIVALENRIPMRFIRHYPTFIATQKDSKGKLPGSSNLKTFVLPEIAFKEINKNPGMHASRAS